jgi:sec-independent protein translocase protein TatB
MLDFGFSEILLTSAIALVVLGPERLPKVARQVGNWMGRARAMARQLSEQLEREVSADELMKAQTKRLEASMSPRMMAPPPPVTPAPETPSHTAATAGADSVAPPHAPAAGADPIARSPAPHAELNHPHNE